MPAPVSYVPRFLDHFPGGRRFVLDVLPPSGVVTVGSALCIQPLAEEANLCRRVLVAQAGRLARRGWHVCIPDLFGTGDSDGTSEDITLAVWRQDLVILRERLADENAAFPRGHRRFVTWGVRLGCPLAVDLVARTEASDTALLLWQPATSLTGILGHGNRLSGSGAPVPRPVEETPQAANRDLTGTRSRYRTVTGHRFSQSFLDELETLESVPVPRCSGSRRAVAIVHMRRQPIPDIAPQSRRGAGEGLPEQLASAPPQVRRLAQRWVETGHRPVLAVVTAEPFWSAIEPTMPEEAFSASEAFLAEL